MLSSIDANADKVVFDQAGFGGFPVFDFGRMGKRPDGSEIRFPMPWQSLAKLTDVEIKALYKYLISL